MTATVQLDIAERVLDSGLVLLAVGNPGVATYACSVSLDVRLADEPATQMGVGNLVGECLDEGTKRRSSLQLAEVVESIGGSMDGSFRGGTVYCPAECQRKGVSLLREMVLEPAFGRREVRRVQAEIVTEILTDQDDPRTVASRRFRREVYGNHPLGRPIQGTRQSVESIKPRDLRTFHGKFFRPAKGYVAAAGPGDPEQLLEELQRAFRGFRGAVPEHQELQEPVLNDRSRNVHIPMAREQVHIYLGHLGIRRADPDFYALCVMDHILGTGPGFTSRCARKLRDEEGLCYAVSAGITPMAGEEPGMFTAYIGTSPENRQRAIDGFMGEIDRIRREPVTAQEVEDVIAYLTGSFAFGLERNSNLAAYAVRARRFGLGFDYLDRYPDLVRSVTPERVLEVAQKHLHPDRMIVVSAGAG